MKYLILTFVIFFLFQACEHILEFGNEDKFIKCDSDCYEVILKGKILDKLTNTGIPNIPVTLKWDEWDCWFCSDKIISIQRTNSSGEFLFKSKIDTSMFAERVWLEISVPENESYIIFPSDREYNITCFEEIGSNNFQFDYYTKTNLQLELVRVKSDTFQYFSVKHWFKNKFIYADYITTSSGEVQENILRNVETAANVYTYIEWSKKYDSNTRKTYIDSIICEPGIVNKYKIEF